MDIRAASDRDPAQRPGFLGAMRTAWREAHWPDRSLALFLFLLPLAPRALPLVIAIMAAMVLVLPAPGGRLGREAWSLTGFPVWMGLFYSWHLIGMIWSDDLDFGRLDLGIKLPLLLIPLMVWRWPRSHGTPLHVLLVSFILGCALSVIIDLARAVTLFLPEMMRALRDEPMYGYAYSNHFFSSRFAWWLHPSYLAHLLALAWFCLQVSEVRGVFPSLWRTLIAALLVVGVLLCQSTMGWIVFAVLFMFAVVLRWRDAQIRVSLLGMLVGAGLAFACIYVLSGSVREELHQLMNGIAEGSPRADDSSGARKQVWQAAMTLIPEHALLGSGTGDVKADLLHRYDELGYAFPLDHRLNAHSQFLQTAVALGISGLLVLLAMVALPLVAAFRSRRELMAAFLVSCILHWSVESMLEVQAGVMCFAGFALLFSSRIRDLERGHAS